MENEVIDWWKEQRDNEGNIVQQEIDRIKTKYHIKLWNIRTRLFYV